MRNLNISKISVSIKLLSIAFIMFAILFVCQAQNVLAADAVPPVITGMTNSTINATYTIEATSFSGAVFTYITPTAFDAYDNASVAVNCNKASGSTFTLGNTTVTCTAIDNSSNIATADFYVSVVDTTAPVISGTPANQIIERTSVAGAVAIYITPTATDIVYGSTTVSCNKASGSVFLLRSTTVICSSTDSSGNSANVSFTIYVNDTHFPIISGTPVNFNVEAVSMSGATATYTLPTATDDIDGAVLVNCLPVSGSTFPLNGTSVVCTALDSFNNKDVTSFVITVSDNTPPVIVGATPNIVAEATSAAGAVVSYTLPAVTDTVDTNVIASCTLPPNSVFALSNNVVTCNAKDFSKNSATPKTFIITVQDTTIPNITGVPSTIVVEATSFSNTIVTYTLPTAYDLVSGNTFVACNKASGTAFNLGNTTITCTSTDAASNIASVSFLVTVRDTTAPNITGVPANQTVEATSASGAVATYILPTASDLVDGGTAVNCNKASGSTFALGTTIVTCNSTDSHANTATKTFSVRVVDTTAPNVTGVPSTIVKEATSASGAIVTYTKPTATDLVSGTTTVICNKASGSTFVLGNTTVTCNSTDVASNTAIVSFLVRVVDTTAPNVTGVPSTIVKEATSASGAIVTYTKPSATDLVSGSTTVNCSKASNTLFALGNTTVTCNSTDAASNTATVSFLVRVVDTIAPTITGVPSTIVKEATSAAGALVNYTKPNATDLVTSNITVNCSKASNTTFALGNTTVTCTAKDAYNNVASVSFIVSVVDTTNPVITGVPSTITVEATSPAGALVNYTKPNATDLVDGIVTVSCDILSNTTFALGSTMVYCVAIDSHANDAWAQFIVTVVDTVAPNITGMPANITMGSSLPTGAIVTYALPNATDIVSTNITVNCSKASGAIFAVGTTIVNCTATDSSNNVASKTFSVTITANPYFTSSGAIVVYDNASINYLIGVNDTGNNKIVGLTVNNANFTISNSTFVFTNRTKLVAGTYPITIVAFNNLSMNNSQAALVTVLTPQQQYINSVNVTVQSNKTEMIINQGSGSLNNIILPSTITVTPMYVNFTALLTAGKTVTLLGDLSLTTKSVFDYTAFFSSGTVISGSGTWDGRLTFPVIQPATYSISGGNVVLVVDVGGNTPLTFSQPAKVVLGGMSGRRAAWAYGTTVFTDIPTVCNSATAPTNINAIGPKECYITSGSDLLIWTYHFTAFGAYDVVVPVTVTSSGGGGGGGGSRYTCGNWTTCVDGTQNRNCTSGSRWQLEFSNCTIDVSNTIVNVTSKVNVTTNLTNNGQKVTTVNTLKNNSANTYSIKKITGNIADDLGSAISGMSSILIPLLVIAMMISLGALYTFYHYKNKRIDTESKKRK